MENKIYDIIDSVAKLEEALKRIKKAVQKFAQPYNIQLLSMNVIISFS